MQIDTCEKVSEKRVPLSDMQHYSPSGKWMLGPPVLMRHADHAHAHPTGVSEGACVPQI